jgi:hypothetical protein
MYNLYSKKATTQGYDSQNVIQVISAECKNTEGKCNYCRSKIYWNPCVIHKHTKKRLPLSKPFNAHGTSPVAHRGCVYNIDNFYNQLVILEKDSKFIQNKKMQEQDKLFGVDESGLSLVQRLIKDRTVVELQRCNEFIKHYTDNTFDSSSTSGINPTKALAGVKVRKK